MNKRQILALAGIGVGSLLISGCGGGGGGGDETPAPENLRVVFSRLIPAGTGQPDNEEIYIANLATSPTPALSNFANLSNNAAIDTSPSFSPSGNSVVFVSRRNGNFEIWSMNSDGTGATALTNSSAPIGGPWNDTEPSVSNNGTVVFTSTRIRGASTQRNTAIYIKSGAGDPTLLITDATINTSFEGFDQSRPAISPDGTKVAFVSNRDSNSNLDIYLWDRTNSSLVRLTTSTTDDTDPSFSADGTQIYYTSSEGGDRNIWRMDTSATTTNDHQRVNTGDAASGEFEPKVYNNHLVYISNAGTGSASTGNIVFYNLSTNTKTTISTGGKDAHPSVR